VITFRRVLALPHDLYAWLYRDRIAEAYAAELSRGRHAGTPKLLRELDDYQPQHERPADADLMALVNATREDRCGCPSYWDGEGDRLTTMHTCILGTEPHTQFSSQVDD
jgi:hypothetical protein